MKLDKEIKAAIHGYLDIINGRKMVTSDAELMTMGEVYYVRYHVCDLMADNAEESDLDAQIKNAIKEIEHIHTFDITVHKDDAALGTRNVVARVEKIVGVETISTKQGVIKRLYDEDGGTYGKRFIIAKWELADYLDAIDIYNNKVLETLIPAIHEHISKLPKK